MPKMYSVYLNTIKMMGKTMKDLDEALGLNKVHFQDGIAGKTVRFPRLLLVFKKREKNADQPSGKAEIFGISGTRDCKLGLPWPSDQNSVQQDSPESVV
jgi:hypothetical protein